MSASAVFVAARSGRKAGPGPDILPVRAAVSRRWTGGPMRFRTASAFAAGLVALAGCAAPESAGSAAVLAKADGWRASATPGDSFAVLEVAYDRATAEALWDENVGADLPARDGAPLEPGVYGDLTDVDLDEQVLALYSSGQSGSCPGWVEDVSTSGDGTVEVSTVQDLRGGDGCTDDYNPYRVVLALDREDVPSADALGTARLLIDDTPVLRARVVPYE